MNPIQPHTSWNILDATKLQCFMDCPRKYFYEYILGWRSSTPNIHLEFGKAWHLAMEHLILSHGTSGKYAEQAVMEAWNLLNDHYRQFFSLEMDDVYAPKNPENALRALSQYAQEYRNDSFTPLYTEIAGTVPISEEQTLSFRMDSILRTEQGIKSREHKTGSTLNRQWTDQWSLSMQTGVYNHVLYCLFPEEEVWGVEINGTFFQKKENKFQRVPARRSISMMNVWLWNANMYAEWIKHEQKFLLESCEVEAPIMQAFPLNTQSCTKYFGCAFHDLCIAWPNPLRNIDRMPDNMKVEWWNPAETEKEAKHVFHLERKG
jgi:hypothetical protein